MIQQFYVLEFVQKNIEIKFTKQYLHFYVQNRTADKSQDRKQPKRPTDD